MISLLFLCILNGLVLSSDGKSTVTCQMKSDVIFALDHSGSITNKNPPNGSWDNWEIILTFVNNAISKTLVGKNDVDYSVITFGSDAEVRIPFNKYQDAESLKAAVLSIPPGRGATNLYSALVLAKHEFDNAIRDVPRVLIVITDGVATMHVKKTLPAAKNLHSAGVTCFTIGVSNQIDEKQLKLTSSPPHVKGLNYWTTPDFTTLPSVIEEVSQRFCYVASTTVPTTVTTVPTTVTTVPTTVTTVPTTVTTVPTTITDRRKSDVIFLLGSSASTTDIHVQFGLWTSWTIILESVINIISANALANDEDVRYSVITYGKEAEVRIPFNAYDDIESLKQAVLTISPVNPGSNFYAGLTLVQQEFQKARQSVPHALIILTDGVTAVNSSTDLSTVQTSAREERVHCLTTAQPPLSSSTAVSSPSSLSTGADSGSNHKPKVCRTKSDIIFALDHSGSIRNRNPPNGSWDNWDILLNFVNGVISRSLVSKETTRFGVLTFGNSAEIQIKLGRHNDAESLSAAVREIPSGNENTNLYAGLLQATKMFRFARARASKILIIITDGMPNRKVDKTLPQARKLHSAGILTFSIGITNKIDEQILKKTSSPPHIQGKNYWTTPDFTTLTGLRDRVADHVCQV